jgi:subtilisin family serine protease
MTVELWKHHQSLSREHFQTVFSTVVHLLVPSSYLQQEMVADQEIIGIHASNDSNFDGYTNSIYTITVAAMDNFQRHPPYSEQCSAVLISTYSSAGGGMQGIVTTDWKGGCTDRHGGTSAAAPLAAGVYALLLSIRYCLRN